jgi:hypothetical protein
MGLLDRIGAFDRYKVSPTQGTSGLMTGAGRPMSPFAQQAARNIGGLLGQDMRTPQEKMQAETKGVLQDPTLTDAQKRSAIIATRLKYETDPAVQQQLLKAQSQLTALESTQSNFEAKAKRLEERGLTAEAAQLRDPTLTDTQKNSIFSTAFQTLREKQELETYGEQLRSSKDPYRQKIGNLIDQGLYPDLDSAKDAIRSRSLEDVEIGAFSDSEYVDANGLPITTAEVTLPDGTKKTQGIIRATGERFDLDPDKYSQVPEDSGLKKLDPASLTAANNAVKGVLSFESETSDLIVGLGDKKEEFIIAVAKEAERLAKETGQDVQSVTSQAVENMVKKINVVQEEGILFGSLETTLGEVPEKPKTQRKGKPGRTARTPETSSGLSADTQALMKRAQGR